ITIFAPKSTMPVVKLIGYYDTMDEINFFNPLFTIRQIRKYNFDAFIDSAQWSRLSAIYTFFSDAKYTVGFNTPGQFKHYVYDKSINHLDTTHEVNNLKNLNVFGKKSSFLPSIKIKQKSEEQKIAVLHTKPGGYLSFLKELPGDYWEKIISYLSDKKFNIYFTGSKEDFESIELLIKNIEDKSNLYNKAGEYSLSETAALLHKASLVISVNTGIMHLASALSCNLVALHGPTNALRWGPLNKNSVSISSKYCCAPCLNLGFEYNCEDRTGACMKAIDFNEILKAIDFFLTGKTTGVLNDSE
ncbi:MAG: glycosyltransferase family 9 protein, partial [Bacteroidota bacterium]|nr:glycosyltransferase family 9 protein [Bacteroidota bacterium]